MTIVDRRILIKCDSGDCSSVIELSLEENRSIMEQLKDSGWQFEHWTAKRDNALNHHFCPRHKR